MSVKRKVFAEYPTLTINIGQAEREILALVYIFYFQKPSVLRLTDRF
jgi:hypothetical protein